MENPTINSVENILKLRAARDEALRAAQAAIRDTTRLTRLMTILSDSAAAPLGLVGLLDRALSTLSELFSADIVVLLDPASSGSFAPLAAIGLPEEMAQEPFSNAEESYTAETIRSRAPILLWEMEGDTRVDAQLRELEAKTGVWLPVTGSHTARGALILARCRQDPFLHAEVGLLSAMSYRIGLSLEQAQRSAQLEQVVKIGREIGGNLDEQEVCSRAAALFPQVIGADAAAVIHHTPGADEALWGLQESWGAAFTELAEKLLGGARSEPGPADGAGHPQDAAHPAEVKHPDEDAGPPLSGAGPFSSADIRQEAEQAGIAFPPDCPVRALLAVPILFQGQAQGWLMGMRFSTVAFNPDALQVAMLYAGQVAAAFETARLYRSARDELAERKQVEKELRASHDRFRALIRSVKDVIIILNKEGQVIYASPAAENAWGCSLEELSGQSLLERVHPDDSDVLRRLIASLLKLPNATLTETLRLRYEEKPGPAEAAGGEPAAAAQNDALPHSSRNETDQEWRDFEVTFTNLLGEAAVGGIVATCHDITERRNYEQELRRLAYRDPLTGLSNRAYFTDYLLYALNRARLDNQSVAVIFFDLDNFKVVNDSLGHAWGDQVLRVTADRLRACLRREDVAARLGGDEFTVIIERVTEPGQVRQVVDRLTQSLKEPIWLKDQDVVVGGSLGVAISEPGEDGVDDVLRKADLAMYAAKSQGKGRYAFYESSMGVKEEEG